jgi:hypothetical protein
MKRNAAALPSAVLIAVLIAATAVSGANPATGHAVDATVEVNALFLDLPAVQQAAGSDFKGAYTVIEVTITPKGDKPLEIKPDDFLLRIPGDADSSGPLAASQVYGAGGALVLHTTRETIGIDRADPGYNGVTIVPGSSTGSADAVKALQSKMLPAKTTSEPATGLLFFPIAKKKPKDLDLVYSSPTGKLHISFK